MSSARAKASGSWFAVVLGVLAPAAVLADRGIDPTQVGWHFSLGPSIAYSYGSGHGVSANLDLTASYSLLSLSLNGKFVQDGKRPLYGPQLELSGYFFVSAGAGVGYLFGSEAGPVIHAFVGVPVPLRDQSRSRSGLVALPYIEPYYRINLFIPGKVEVIHEAGVFLKLALHSANP
ncbi:MAG: hypothetical protein HY901_15360 [Deltaproteobacteria bacterium]|nr:hypothetical protein [Deltaproteobacteria bacterium]